MLFPSNYRVPYLSKTSAFRDVKRIIPPLTTKLHKGSSGRIGVIGGSKDYTGAPFFSCHAAQLLGADLGHIICDPKAGQVIKGYSPDLIVHPVLRETYELPELRSTLKGLLGRLHAIVIGPGLGRDEYMQVAAKTAIQIAREQEMYIVIDADGLWLVQNDLDVIRGYPKAILTPNVVEFKRLCSKLGIDEQGPPEGLAKEMATKLGHVTILQKGPEDIISNGHQVLISDDEGGLKRCGGQGDVLSGACATFLGWAKNYEEQGGFSKDEKVPLASDRLTLLAALGGSVTTRTCSRLAFKEAARAMQTTDLLKVVGKAYQEHFGDLQTKL